MPARFHIKGSKGWCRMMFNERDRNVIGAYVFIACTLIAVIAVILTAVVLKSAH